MSKRRNRKPRNLAHGAVEKEMRALHRKGEHVERQRDLTRALLHAVLIKSGGSVLVTREELDAGAGGTSSVEDVNGSVNITFTPDDEAPAKRRTLWRRFTTVRFTPAHLLTAAVVASALSAIFASFR